MVNQSLSKQYSTSTSFSSGTLVFSLAGLSLSPYLHSGTALLLGIVASVLFGNPFLKYTKKVIHPLLALAVMGLGAGLDLMTVTKVGLEGLSYTLIGILFTVGFGHFTGSILGVAKHTSLLISVGTAICGGSAIAALAPVLRAKHEEVSVALGTVFLVNALALFLFPEIGKHFHLSPPLFGIWSALAIHDTSSVVGATLSYHPESVGIGTTVKLARALWIIPVTLIASFSQNRISQVTQNDKPRRPWFILGFLISSALVTFVPSLREGGHFVETCARRLMVMTLFLIGCNLTKETLKSVGIKPLIHGFLIWGLVGTGTLAAIVLGWIRMTVK